MPEESSKKDGWPLETRAALGAALAAGAFGLSQIQTGMGPWMLWGIVSTLEATLFVRYVRLSQINAAHKTKREKLTEKN